MDAILLLEDDESFGYILSEYLRMKEMEVVWVKTAEAALQTLERQSFRLAILDIMLPIVNGYELCQALRREEVKIPVIMLTAKSDESDVVLGLGLGADDYMTKPFTLDELASKLVADARGYTAYGEACMDECIEDPAGSTCTKLVQSDVGQWTDKGYCSTKSSEFLFSVW